MLRLFLVDVVRADDEGYHRVTLQIEERAEVALDFDRADRAPVMGREP